MKKMCLDEVNRSEDFEQVVSGDVVKLQEQISGMVAFALNLIHKAEL